MEEEGGVRLVYLMGWLCLLRICFSLQLPQSLPSCQLSMTFCYEPLIRSIQRGSSGWRRASARSKDLGGQGREKAMVNFLPSIPLSFSNGRTKCYSQNARGDCAFCLDLGSFQKCYLIKFSGKEKTVARLQKKTQYFPKLDNALMIWTWPGKKGPKSDFIQKKKCIKGESDWLLGIYPCQKEQGIAREGRRACDGVGTCKHLY